MYEKWRDSREPTELGVSSFATDTLLKRIKDKYTECLINQASLSLARASMVRGVAPVEVTISELRDASLRSVHSAITIETIVAPTLIGYTENLESALISARCLFDLPWWKYLWRRMRGRAEVRLPWEPDDTTIGEE